MSLIINMLKDLENRQNSNAEIPAMAASHQHYTVRNRDGFKKIIAVVAIGCIIAASVYLLMKKSSLKITIPAAAENTIKTAEIPNHTNDILLSPATISAVSFETKDQSTEISFLLSHSALYRIVGNKDNNRVTLYINNAKMESDLPTLVGAETGIQHISSRTDNGELQFTISLKPGAYLQAVNLDNETKNPVLLLSIGLSKSPPDELFASTSNIKTPAMQTIIMERYHSAVKMAELGNTQEAIDSLSKLLQYYPDYNDARVSLAAIILESGNPVKARKIIDDGLAIDPDYIPLVELKARLLTSEGKIKEALVVLQSEQPPINEAPGYHAFIAALFSRENNYQLAANIYRQLVEINPHEGSWWFGLGVSLDKLGQNQDAAFAYTKAATEGRLNAQALAFLQTRLQTLQREPHVKE